MDLFFQLVHLILQLSVVFLLLFVQPVDERSAEILGIVDHSGILHLNLLAFSLIIQAQVLQVFLMLLQLELEILTMRIVQFFNFLLELLVPLRLVVFLPLIFLLKVVNDFLVFLLLFGQEVALLLILGIEQGFHLLLLRLDFFH